MHIANSLNIGFDRFPEAALLPRLAAAGYDGADFNFWDLARRLDWHDAAAADPWLDALAAAATEAGLAWVQGHGPVFGPDRNDPEDAFQRALCLPALRACGRLDVPWLVLHPVSVPLRGDDREGRHAAFAANVDGFRALLPACEAHGVGIAIENKINRPPDDAPETVPWPGARPEDLCEIVDALDHPLAGACWDTGHAQLNGLDQRRALAMLGSRLKVLHLHENDGREDLHLLPFTFPGAPARWEAIAAGLREAGYAGALTLEVAAAFRAVPDGLFDDLLRHSARLGEELAAMVEGRIPGPA